MTLVSFQHDFIYLRTRKTAGTSTEMYLQPYCMEPGRSVEEYNPRQIVSTVGIVGRRLAGETPPFYVRAELAVLRMFRLGAYSPHMSAARLRQLLAPEFWTRALKISSVRNPYIRMVSTYYWSLRHQRAAPTDPEVMIREFRRMVKKGAFNNDRDVVMIGREFVPDVLIRQEHLGEDLAALAGRLGLDTSLTRLPVTKKTVSSDATSRPAIRDFYDDETAAHVRKSFAWAFKHGKYTLELPQ